MLTIDTKIIGNTSSSKDTRRVSFQEVNAVGMTTDTEDEDKQATSVSVSDYDVTDEEEESEEAEEWPAVKAEVCGIILDVLKKKIKSLLYSRYYIEACSE